MEAPITINDAMGDLTYIYHLYVDPTGKQIRNFLDETIMACYVASQLKSERKKATPVKLQTRFVTLLKTLGVKEMGDKATPWDMYETIYKQGSNMQAVFRKLQVASRLSTKWASNVESVTQAIRNFEDEAMMYCKANMRCYSGDDAMKALVELWKTQSETKDRLDPQLFATFLFFPASNDSYFSPEVDASYLRTMRTFEMLGINDPQPGRTKIDQLFKNYALNKAKRIFGRITFIAEPFDDPYIVESKGIFIDNLRHKYDPLQATEFLERAFRVILKKDSINKYYAMVLVELCRLANPYLETILGIAREPSPQADDTDEELWPFSGGEEDVGPGEVQEKGVLAAPPHETQLKKFRTDDVKAEAGSTDSGMALPIILMIGLVFLLSS